MFSDDPEQPRLSDESAPFECDWFAMTEKGLETGAMAHMWDETAKIWFVKIALERLRASGVRLIKRHRGELHTLAEKAVDLIGPVGRAPSVDQESVRSMIQSG